MPLNRTMYSMFSAKTIKEEENYSFMDKALIDDGEAKHLQFKDEI